MEQKKLFEEPKMEVVRFDARDIFTYNSNPIEMPGGGLVGDPPANAPARGGGKFE